MLQWRRFSPTPRTPLDRFNCEDRKRQDSLSYMQYCVGRAYIRIICMYLYVHRACESAPLKNLFFVERVLFILIRRVKIACKVNSVETITKIYRRENLRRSVPSHDVDSLYRRALYARNNVFKIQRKTVNESFNAHIWCVKLQGIVFSIQ